MNKYNKKLFFYFLLLLAYCSLIAVVYWEIKYYTNAENDMRHEYRIGTALIMTYTFPFWLSVPSIAMLWKRNLSKLEISSSFIPVLLIALIVLSWGA